MQHGGVKVLPTVPVLKQSDVASASSEVKKLVSFKSKRNSDIDEHKVKRFERGSTEVFILEGNLSCNVKITTDTQKTGSIWVSLVCKDSLGSLVHYVVKEEVGSFEVLVENLLDVQREFKLNYLIYFD